jgi:hypothetical protein
MQAPTDPPASKPKRKAPRVVAYDDVDDIIGIASEMQNLDADRLSVEDLREVASDLEVPEQYLGPAIVELKRRREALLAAEAEKRKRRKIIGFTLGGVVVLVVIWALGSQRSLASELADVQAARAQVENVVTLRKRKIAEWGPKADSPERAAELAGADNRVAIERRKYDEAARRYNAKAGGFPTGLWAAVFGMPSQVPTSDAMNGW